MKQVNSPQGIDRKQFEQLFKQQYTSLFHFAQRYVQDEDTAKDICQQVFIKLWEKRADIDPKLAMKSYLFTSVRNKCLNHIRDHKKFRSKVLDLDCGTYELNVDPEEMDETGDLQQRIQTALESLPTKCRRVFEMSRFQQMKYREIAEELDIAQKTVEAHMSKAMKVMRTALQHYLVFVCLLMEIFR